jgi:diguanylate cyclase (GGDEF)-like protein/PAS domain S-box-containing protein
LKNSLRVRFAVINVAVTVLLGAIVFGIANNVLNQRMENDYIDKGNAVARTIARMVKGEAIDRYISRLDRDEEYETTLSLLRTMQREHGLLYVCVIQMVEDGEVLVFGTGEPEGGPSSLGKFISWKDFFGEGHDDYINALLRSEEVGPLVSNGIYGHILSAYEPIYRDDGSVAAYACVDISMDQLKRDEAVMFMLASIGLASILVLSIAASLFTFRRYILLPINTLLDQSESVHAVLGDSAKEAPLQARLKFDDELAALERAIIDMELRIRAEVAERLLAEENYRTKIEEQMEKMSILLNSLDEYICITVPETGEILFINDNIRKVFGVEGDGLDHRCYELLQSQTNKRCDFCPWHQLEKEPDRIIEWEQQQENRTYRKTARIIDWPGGVKAHLEVGIDITEIIRAQEMAETILYEIDSYIMITDLMTDEILFTNRKIMTDFGFDESVIGGKCWQYLRSGMEKRCSFCRKGELLQNPDEPVIWEDSNYLLGKDMIIIERVIDWPGRQKAHMHQAIDVSAVKQAQMEAYYHAKVTGTLNSMAIILLSQKGEKFERTMTDGIGLVAEMMYLDRVTVWRNIMKPDGLYGTQVFRWNKEDGGTTLPIAQFAEFKVSEWLPRWEKILSAGDVINGPVRPLPEAAVLQSFGCVSVFIDPIITNKEFLGFVMFEDRSRERVFTEGEAKIFQTTSLMISSTLARHEEAEKIQKANENLNLLLNAMPLGCLVWNRDMKIIDCNETAIKLFGFKNKQELMENYTKSWPEYQQNGSLSHETAYELLRTGFVCDSLAFEWMSQHLDGTPIPLQIILKQIKFTGGDAIASFARDLRDYKRMMSEIEQQTLLLNAVNSVAAIMLESRVDSFENDLVRSLEIMAEIADADRVYIWKNFFKGGKLYCTQIHEWSGKAESQKNFKYAVETLYDDVVPGWEEKLSKGNCISGNVREMSDYEKAALSPQGILSILIVPVFLKNQFWGFFGFDNCHEEHAFSKREELLLRSASQIIANALFRYEETERARKAEERIKLMLDATPFGCQIIDHNRITIDCNEAAVKLFGFRDKQEFIEQSLNGCSPEYQPDGQSSDEKRFMFMKKAIEEGSCTFEWTYITSDGTLLPAEVTLTRVEYENTFVLVRYMRDLREIKKMSEDVLYLKTEAKKIYLDPLTDIYNRRYLDENLKSVISSLSRSGAELSLMIIDIDHFKKYNDTYGHPKGDDCLKTVATTLKNSLTRADDFVVRYGGEEFAIILPNTGEKGAHFIANKLLKNIQDQAIPHETSDVADHVTISIGVCSGTVKHVHSSLYWLRLADEMVYKSKLEGRNRYNLRKVEDS